MTTTAAFHRVRPAPVERFEGDSHEFHLGASVAALRAEAHQGQHGHRQVTLFHRPPVTYVLFAFESGGGLPEHLANGLVTIQVLEGRIEVTADSRDHQLAAGHVLMLNPNVRHDVRALEASAMLLTVQLEPGTHRGDAASAEAHRGTPKSGIPESVQLEHADIHAALVAATKAPGRVGAAARELAEVLHPHFVREEEIALPPLGLLAPLAADEPLPSSTRSEALAMTDALRSELPRMLAEHVRIRAAVERLGAAARAENTPEHVQLAERLALHARTEEEVLYPAAVLVGDVIRARSGVRPLEPSPTF